MTMQLIKTTLFIIFILSFHQLFAQPKINFDELQKKYPDNKTLVLNDEDRFDLKVKDDKIIIENKTFQQYLYLDEKIGGYSQHSFSYNDQYNEITNIEACTYVPDGDKYKKVKVKQFTDKVKMSDDAFYDGNKAKEFVLPSIQKRAITEISCAYIYKNPSFIGYHYFKYNSPVLKSTYTVSTSSDIKIKFIVRGDTSGIKLVVTEKRNKKIYTWTAENISELKTYDDGPNVKYYAPHIFMYIEEFKTSKGAIQKVSGSEKDLFKLYQTFINNLNAEKPDPELKNLVDSIKNISKTDDDLIKNIYYWAQSNIKYIAFEDGIGGHKPREANDIYFKRFGDCKDFSSIITSMLKIAGIKSYICWIGTRDIPYKFSEVPLPYSSNHMIAAVHQNNEWYFLDGTASFLRYKTPSGFIQGKEAMVCISPDSFLMVQIPIVKSDENTAFDSIILSIENKKLIGNAFLKLDGYNKYYMATKLEDIRNKDLDEEFKNILSKGNNKCKVTQYEYDNFYNRDTPTFFKYNFEIDDYVRQIDSDIFINMNLMRYYQNSKIDTANKRNCIREFRYAYFDEGITVLNIPEGYKLKKLPNNLNYSSQKFSFQFNYKQKGNTIIFSDNFRFNDIELKPEEFEEWNIEIGKIVDVYKDLVVLTKK